MDQPEMKQRPFNLQRLKMKKDLYFQQGAGETVVVIFVAVVLVLLYCLVLWLFSLFIAASWGGGGHTSR